MNYTAARIACVTLAGLASLACIPAEVGPLREETQSLERQSAETQHVDLKMGAGELRVQGGSPNLADLAFRYNVEQWKPRVRHVSTNPTHSDLEIEQGQGGSGVGDTKNEWDISLNNDVELDLSAQLGAGEASFDLGNIHMREADVKMGAGKLTMDLRGDPASSYHVRIEGGAGSATVYLPRTVGVWATAQGGLGSIDVRGLEEHNGRWVNPGHENDRVTVRVDVQGGVGEIRLIAQ